MYSSVHRGIRTNGVGKIGWLEKYVSCRSAIIICTRSKLTCASVLFEKPDFSRFSGNPVFDINKAKERGGVATPAQAAEKRLRNGSAWTGKCPDGSPVWRTCQLVGIRWVRCWFKARAMRFFMRYRGCRQQPPEDASRTRSAIQHSTTCMSWNLNSKIHIQLIICWCE